MSKKNQPVDVTTHRFIGSFVIGGRRCEVHQIFAQDDDPPLDLDGLIQFGEVIGASMGQEDFWFIADRLEEIPSDFWDRLFVFPKYCTPDELPHCCGRGKNYTTHPLFVPSEEWGVRYVLARFCE